MSGPPLSSAPGYLRPYLDCVDGIVATGGYVDRTGRTVATSWALFRGGKDVGHIAVRLDGLPLGFCL